VVTANVEADREKAVDFREKTKMALALKRFKVYLKLIAISVAVAIGLLVVLKNLKRTADVWFFHEYKEVCVLWLILVTSVLSIAGWWGVRKVIGVLRDFRDLRRAQETQRQVDEQRRLAEDLAQREKRIDQKVRRSIAEDT